MLIDYEKAFDSKDRFYLIFQNPEIPGTLLQAILDI